MASDSRLMSSLVISECKEVFEGVDSLVDIAGGTGTMAKGIAKAFPNMSCIVLDLPHVIEGLKGSNNLSFVAGDMFAPLPTTNAILLKWILHDWNDDKCVEILKRCKEALTSKGKVIIIDMVVDQETKLDEVETQLFYDMHLMMLNNGKERNEKEWAKLFFDAGFTYYKITHKLGVRSMIEKNLCNKFSIPDVIHKHGKPMPLSNLVEALSINKAKAGCLQRLMRLLIHSGFFVQMPEGYALTLASRLLLKDNPFSVAPVFETMLDPIVTQPWKDGIILANGSKLMDMMFRYSRAFIGAHSGNLLEKNQSLTILLTNLWLPTLDVFEGLDSLVDVGGGTGTMAKVIANAFPNTSCIVLDLPHVIEGLKGRSNLSFVVGDMFLSLPKTDAILLKWILHDWTDDKYLEILERCKESLTSKCKVIIIDMVVDQGRKCDEVETQIFYDMHLMTLNNGKERNEKEWAKLFFDAGFTYYKITHKLGVRSLIEVYL
ncbi:hypothetical protein Leryth_012295 [Lithospermum erythrorhizon]|nr:hypothetical protein Leryth_012295 [Lithospermum erythrorhizon]